MEKPQEQAVKDNLECSVCGYQCKSTEQLEKHKLAHTGGKPLACSECDFTCPLFQTLVDHMAAHAKKKKLVA